MSKDDVAINTVPLPDYPTLDLIPRFWRWADPIPEIRRFIPKEKYGKLIQIELAHIQKGLQMQMDFCRELSELVGK